jgi:hypothetical protein
VFEEYLQDSYDFFITAQKASEESDNRKARRYYRASVFYAASAMEAFVNYTADAFAKGESLSPHEIAFLNDKILTFSARKGELVEQTKYYSIDNKLRCLIRRFVPDFEFETNTSWTKFMELKNLRDSLVHPRQSEDETEVADYQEKICRGISGTIELMNYISKGIYKTPLRKQLLDLIPE